MAADTQADRALAKALADVAAGSAADTRDFWAAWQRDGGKVIDSLPAFHAACADADAALTLMNRVVAVLTGREGAPLAARLSDKAQNLTVALMSSAVDRFLRLELQDQFKGSPDTLTLTVGYRVTAEMLSAMAHDCGLLWERQSGSELYRVDNVRWDHPSHEFGSEDAAFDAWMAELQAWCDARRNGQSLRDRLLNPHRLQPNESPDPRWVRDELKRVEREWGVRPLLAAIAADKSSLSTDAALRTRLKNELGVGSALVTLAEKHLLEKAINRAETTVQRCLQRLFVALQPQADSASVSTLPAAPVRGRVFISYAHKDGHEWMEKLSDQLGALHDSALVDEWSDTKLKGGDDWRQKIEGAMQTAACAVLILTPGFLQSAFIKQVELPTLIRKHRDAAGGLTLFPVVAKACPWTTCPDLNWLQAECAHETLEELAPQGLHTRRLSDLAQQIAKLLNA